MQFKIAHIINPVKVSKSSDLYIAQPVTFESMRRAKEMSSPEMQIDLYTTQFQEDLELIPEWFIKTSNLNKSVLDVASFKKRRKLPLIKDIIRKLFLAAPNADYYIYTNVDIGLYPNFYTSLNSYLSLGHDAILINRRTISNKYKVISELPFIYADNGSEHEGIDGFVFSKEIIEKLILGNSIIGSGPVGIIFAFNLLTFAHKPIWLQNSHLTFHIGDDKSWLNPELNDYEIFNFSELKLITQKLIKNITSNQVLRDIFESSFIFINAKINGKIPKYTDIHPKKLIGLYLDDQIEEVKKLLATYNAYILDGEQQKSGSNISTLKQLIKKLLKTK